MFNVSFNSDCEGWRVRWSSNVVPLQVDVLGGAQGKGWLATDLRRRNRDRKMRHSTVERLFRDRMTEAC